MKPSTLLSALFVLSLSLIMAQPVLTQSDIAFQIGDTHVIDSIAFTDMTGQEGPNMTWDLSSLTTQGTLITGDVVDPSATSTGSNFPNSTIARTFNYMGFVFDQFFNFDGASMQHLGSTFGFGGTEYISDYYNPEIAIPLPMIYNTSGTDTYASEQSGVPGDVSTSGEINWEVPGYGTLLVNGQTYNDVLMYKFTRLDTTVSTFSGFTFESYSVELSYFFMAAGYHYPIVIFTEISTTDEFSPPVTTYEGSVLISQTTGLNEASNILPDLKVFPNPVSTNQLTVSYSMDVPMGLELNVVDLSGRVILQETLSKQSGQVSQRIQIPEEIEAGLYLLRFNSDDGSRTVPIEIQ
jgi:hypothetical protein